MPLLLNLLSSFSFQETGGALDEALSGGRQVKRLQTVHGGLRKREQQYSSTACFCIEIVDSQESNIDLTINRHEDLMGDMKDCTPAFHSSSFMKDCTCFSFFFFVQ